MPQSSRKRRNIKYDAIAKRAKDDALREVIDICRKIEGRNGDVSDVRKIVELELMNMGEKK